MIKKIIVRGKSTDTFFREKMFKTRITRWKLNKNYKAAERIAVAQIIRSHKTKRCTSPQVLLHGRPVKMHRVQRHCRTRIYSPGPSSNDHVLSLTEDDKRCQVRCTCCESDIRQDEGYQARIMLSGVQKQVVLASKPQPPLPVPTELKNIELILHQTNVFYRSYCQVQTSRNLSRNINGRPTEIQYKVGINPVAFRNLVLAGSDALRSGQQTAGWRLLHEASDLTLPMLKQHHPRTLDSLLDLASNLEAHGNPDIFRSIWSFIREMTSTILGLMHPVSLTCKALLVIEDKNIVYTKAIEIILNILEQRFGRYESMVLQMKSMYIDSLSMLADSDQLTRDLLQDYTYVKDGSGVVYTLVQLGYINLRQNDINGALKVFRDAVRRGKTSSKSCYPTQADLCAAIGLASTIFHQNEYSEGESLLKECLEICIRRQQCRPHDWRTISLLKSLEIFLRKEGKLQEADDLRFKYSHVF
jgi:hypothetical protein